MKRFRNFPGNQISTLLVFLLCLLLVSPPVEAGERRILTPRRALGLAFLGGSAALVKRGMDFKEEADELYERYEKATDPQEIDRLYRRTNNRDVKSQVSWALAAAFAVSGLRLILTGETETEFGRFRSFGTKELLSGLPGWRIEVESRADGGGIGIGLRRSFF